MEDGYFFLLEQPQYRQYGLCGERMRYRTRSFDPAYYAAVNGHSFADEDDAYSDWLTRGRALGLAYAEGRDTILKIVLKAKDEPELLPLWIRHHAAIVGMENLVVLDCGSTEPAYRELLDDYADRLLILRYPLYYDFIHTPAANPGFFDLLARNCRYLTILDADEFLIGREGDIFSTAAVKQLLATSEQAIFASAWVPATAQDTQGPASLDLSIAGLTAGTIAGKSVVRSTIVDTLGHFGHNMHDAGVLARLAPQSFGRIAILHLTLLDPAIVRRRARAHLQTKGLIAHDADDTAIRAIAARDDLPPMAREYALRCLGETRTGEPIGQSCRLIGGATAERLPALADALDAIDPMALAQLQAERL